TALEMPRKEKRIRNKTLHKRLQDYNVNHWAEKFLKALHSMDLNARTPVHKDLRHHLKKLKADYVNAQRRILFLDYDGTLVRLEAMPEWARPDKKLKELLLQIAEDPKNTVVIASGRDRHTLEDWLGDLNLYLLADHGLWLKYPKEKWKQT